MICSSCTCRPDRQRRGEAIWRTSCGLRQRGRAGDWEGPLSPPHPHRRSRPFSLRSQEGFPALDGFRLYENGIDRELVTTLGVRDGQVRRVRTKLIEAGREILAADDRYREVTVRKGRGRGPMSFELCGGRYSLVLSRETDRPRGTAGPSGSHASNWPHRTPPAIGRRVPHRGKAEPDRPGQSEEWPRRH
jgi:hypothetical protein